MPDRVSLVHMVVEVPLLFRLWCVEYGWLSSCWSSSFSSSPVSQMKLQHKDFAFVSLQCRKAAVDLW